MVKHKTNNLNIEPERNISKLHDLTQGDPLKSQRTTLFVDNIDQQLKYRLYLAMLPSEFKCLWMNLTVVSSRLIRSSRNLYQQNYSVQYNCLLPGNQLLPPLKSEVNSVRLLKLLLVEVEILQRSQKKRCDYKKNPIHPAVYDSQN